MEVTIKPVQREAFNYYKKNTMSVELVKDDHLQKINFRVKDKVLAFDFIWFCFLYCNVCMLRKKDASILVLNSTIDCRMCSDQRFKKGWCGVWTGRHRVVRYATLCTGLTTLFAISTTNAKSSLTRLQSFSSNSGTLKFAQNSSVLSGSTLILYMYTHFLHNFTYT